MNDDINRDIPDHELDRIIGAALVVDADAAGVERLKHYWRVEARKDRWQRRAYLALTTAAAALVLIGLLVVAKDGDENAKTASVVREPVQVPADIEQAQGIAAEESDHAAASRLAGRAPTEYERFVFIARTGRRTPAMAESKVDEAKGPRPASTEEMVAEIEQTGGVEGLILAAKRTREPQLQRAAIARLLEIETDEAILGYLALVRDGTTRPAAMVAAEDDSQLPLGSMLAFLDHDDRAVRRSAAVVLGHVNGPEVTQALIARVTEEPSGATETWMALVECRGEMAQQFVAYAATRPQLLGHLNGARVQLAYVVP